MKRCLWIVKQQSLQWILVDNFENIQSNGRELIWNTNLELFYKPNPITGAGLGESMEFTKENFAVKLFIMIMSRFFVTRGWLVYLYLLFSCYGNSEGYYIVNSVQT